MRFPIKLNPSVVPVALRNLGQGLIAPGDPSRLPSLHAAYRDANDPAMKLRVSVEFSQAVSALKFGTTFKTTSPHRLPASTSLLLNHLRGENHIIADLAASDATTTVDLAIALGRRFRRLIATDLNDNIEIARRDGTTLVFDASGLLLITTSRLVWYRDTARADPLSRTLVKRKFKQEESQRHSRTPVRLMNPRFIEMMSQDDRLEFRCHDIFEPLPFAPTIIRFANVLNPGYFSDAEIAQAFTASASRLAETGLLLITRNHARGENASLFRRCDRRLQLVDEIGQGNEVANIAASIELG